MADLEEPPMRRTPETTWAQSRERLRAPDAPAGAVNLNVTGRQVVGPLQGFGPLWQKTYRVLLDGLDISPAELIALWKAEFPTFHPSTNRFYPSLAGIEPGEVVLINAMTPGGLVSTGVMVLYADDESFTLMTPEGHPESGWVTFSAYRDEAGCLVAQVQSMARTNDPIYEVAFRLMGAKIQEQIWEHVLVALAAHYGLAAQVELKKSCVDPRVQWGQARNVWHNAQIRTMAYVLAAPARWVQARLGG